MNLFFILSKNSSLFVRFSVTCLHIYVNDCEYVSLGHNYLVSEFTKRVSRISSVLGHLLSDFTLQKLHFFENIYNIFIVNLLYYILMELNYNNYIISKTESKFTSHFTLTDLGRTRQNENRMFRFKLTPELSSIQAQADFFANYIIASGVFDDVAITQSRRANELTSLIAKTYIYSYIKSITYAHGRVNRELTYMMGPKNNLVFYGHKVLHDTICEGYIQYFSLPSNIISLQVDTEDENIATFESWEIWSEIFNVATNRLFNAKFETILGILKNKATNLVSIDAIGESVCSEVKNFPTLPIGNLAFSSDMLSIKFVESNALSTDKVSFYFGKAVMLTLVSYPDIDSDDDIYDTISVDSYDNFGINFEVQSVTGFNPISNIMTAREVTGNKGDGNSPIDKLPYSSSKGSNPQAFNTNNRTFQRRSRNNNNNKNLKSTTNVANNAAHQFIINKKNQVVQLTKNAMTILRNVDIVMTDDTVNAVAAIVSQLTGKNLLPIEFRNRMGARVGAVLADYGIRPIDTMTTSTSEYDSFYALQHNEDGFIRTELVGTPKLITQK